MDGGVRLFGRAALPETALPPNGTGVAALVCCLLLSPCDDKVTCSTVSSAEGCRGLAAVQLPPTQDEWWTCAQGQDGGPSGPDWELVAWPFFYIPLASLAAMALLWLALTPLYGVVAKREHWHKLILNHIGTLDHPSPRVVDFMVLVTWVQIVASLLTTGVFVFKTYAQDVPLAARVLDATLGFLLTVHYFIHGIRNEFNLRFLFDVGQLVDLATVPGMVYTALHADKDGRDWLSLGFLRLVPALLAYERLVELGALGRNSSEVVQHLVRMAFRFFAFVICGASLVLIFEVLGDPLHFQRVKIVTGMGEIDYFTVGYWIIETISLVGYGEFSPSTVFSRFVAILTMISGFAVFTFELGKILSLIDKGKRGAGSYMPTSRDHVVLVGGGIQNIDETFMTAFLEELYHKSYRNTWPDLVMMACGPDSVNKARDLCNHNLDREARQHVTYLDGSPLNDHDLKRSRCSDARLVWIIADTTGSNDPYDEDKENILRALSLSVRYSSTPVLLMLLMPDSKSKAIGAGIHRQRCFCLNEIKSGLFWQSCRCIGLNTMLSNLMVTTDAEVHEGELLDSPWLANYVDGMGHEVYGLLAAKEFLGKEYVYLVEEAYMRNRICIFAAQVEGVVVLAPLRQLHNVQEDSVFFALAQDELMLHGIARRSSRVDWKAVFQENSVRHWKRQAAASEEQAPSDDALAKNPKLLPGTYNRSPVPARASQTAVVPKARQSRHRGSGAPAEARPGKSMVLSRTSAWTGSQKSSTASTVPTRAFQSIRNNGTRSAGLRSMTKSQVTPGDFMASFGLDTWRTVGATNSTSTSSQIDLLPLTAGEAEISAVLAEELMRELEDRAISIREKSSTAPFVLVLEFSGSWEEVILFVSLSRKKYLPFKMPLIVLCPATPTVDLEQTLNLRSDPALSLVWGSPHKKRDLEIAGVRECNFVVGLGQTVGHATGEIAAMLDSDVVMSYRMLERMSKNRTNMIFEFNKQSSMWLLPKEHNSTVEDHVKAPAPGTNRTMLEIAYLDSRFASGRVFAPQALGSLLAHSFHTPGIVEVVTCLVTPEDGDGAEDAHLRKYMPWQLKLRPEYCGMTYGDLLITLITDSMHPVLPVGIYRCFESKVVLGNRGYVWTNPPKDTVLVDSDMVYVMGDASFGQLAHTNDLMPMGPAGLTNLVAFRSARLISR